jgi:regulator of sirC expression with transglutaminase-like and TPR domain
MDSVLLKSCRNEKRWLNGVSIPIAVFLPAMSHPDSHRKTSMALDVDYSADTEFSKLLARRDDVDLTRAALELARDAYPRLDFEETFRWIAARQAELAGPVALIRDDREMLQALSRCLAETHGLFGDDDCFLRPDSSYLNRVIETGRGLPISLSVLYMAVAGAVGLQLHGVGAPMHFLTRYESSDGPLFIDAFTHGRIMTYDEALGTVRARAQLETSSADAALRAVKPRDIITRMLNNLKAIHAGREQWSAAWIVQHRLTSLQPASYQERRDLALISLKADRPGDAVELLNALLKICPDDEQDLLIAQRTAAQNLLARWN